MATVQAGIVLRHLRGLAGGRERQLPDGTLLEQFTRRQEEAAFAALVERHGPLVLGVCRRVLGNAHDAEDAFQATFLALARRAASVRGRASLGGWLYRVAYRTALRARSRAAARATREQKAGSRPTADPLAEVTGRELLTVLDEELQRLPEEYRTPLVLCYLREKTGEEAARELGWPLRTLQRRLEEGRKRLRSRLARRGLTLAAALLGAGVSRGEAGVPRPLVGATVRAALGRVAGKAARPLLTRCLAVLAAGALVLGAGALAKQTPAGPRPEATTPKETPAPPKDAAPEPVPQFRIGSGSGKEMNLSGRVLDDAGKPVAGAEVAVVVWPHHFHHEGDTPALPEVWAKGKAGPDGRFRFAVPRPVSLDAYKVCASQLAVLAGHKGHGLGWHYLPLDADKGEVEVRLRPEQVQRGRLVDLQGQPAAGVRIEVVRAGKPAPRYDHFGRRTEDGSVDGKVGLKAIYNGTGSKLWEEEVFLPEAPAGVTCWPRATTDGAGRFTLRGVGRDQTVTIRTRGNAQVASEWFTFAPSADARPAEKTFTGAAPCLIEGKVVDAETGKPVAGARVQVEVAGAALFLAQWPRPADWKGRQGLAGPGFAPTSQPLLTLPPECGVTDAAGGFRITPFRRQDFSAQGYSVIVSPPTGGSYLTVKKSVYFPRGTLRQAMRVKLPRGVLVRGKVVEVGTGKPVAWARLDFWSKGLKLPSPEPIGLRPEGILYPPPRRADHAGAFEIIVPPGRCHLLVNARGTDYALSRVEAEELGVKDVEGITRGFALPPWGKPGAKPHYYPDAVLVINQKAGTRAAPVVKLRRAPVLKGRLLRPDGMPAAGVTLIRGQEPFAEHASGSLPLASTRKDGTFELPFRNLEAPMCLAFLDTARDQGGIARFTSKQAEAGPVTVRLAACGKATVRFRDAAGKPLAGYHPLLLLSLPEKPFSDLARLDRLAKDSPWWCNYDAVWPGLFDPSFGKVALTDKEGRVTLPHLIPGATYRLACGQCDAQAPRRANMPEVVSTKFRLTLFAGKSRDFMVEAGKTINLGDLTVSVSPTKK
jgi:RNA polymerase sigma factor (sigma-70 family)